MFNWLFGGNKKVEITDEPKPDMKPSRLEVLIPNLVRLELNDSLWTWGIMHLDRLQTPYNVLENEQHKQYTLAVDIPELHTLLNRKVFIVTLNTFTTNLIKYLLLLYPGKWTAFWFDLDKPVLNEGKNKIEVTLNYSVREIHKPSEYKGILCRHKKNINSSRQE